MEKHCIEVMTFTQVFGAWRVCLPTPAGSLLTQGSSRVSVPQPRSLSLPGGPAGRWLLLALEAISSSVGQPARSTLATAKMGTGQALLIPEWSPQLGQAEKGIAPSRASHKVLFQRLFPELSLSADNRMLVARDAHDQTSSFSTLQFFCICTQKWDCWTYGSSIFNFLRNHHTVFPNSYTILHSPQLCPSVPIPSHSRQH